ncbi:MAG: hypothetical protein RLZ75_633 [Pseudomonadota bacterium]
MKKYTAIIICLTLTGCASHLKTDQYEQITETTSYDYSLNVKNSEKYYKNAYTAATTCKAKKEVRNSILFEQMRLIDSAYNDYESDIRKGVDGKKLFTDIASIGLSSAASIIGGAGIKSILALTDTGLKGVGAAYDSDYLQGKTIDIIISQIRSSRAEVATQIIGDMKDENCAYSMEKGIFDLGNYIKASTLDNALISLATTASNFAKEKETALATAVKCLSTSAQCPETKK